MSKSESELPERLRVAGGTELERRLLNAAGREQPPRELSARMALAIGVSMPPVVGNVGSADAGSGAAPGASGTATTAATASTSFAPWIMGAVVVAAVAGLFAASRPGPVPPAAPAHPTAPSAVAPSPVVAPPDPPTSEPPAPTTQRAEPAALPNPPSSASPRSRGGATENDLHVQTALVDAARAALARGNADRALGLVRDYQTRYPSGSFRPEAAAVRVEALVKLGRSAEARSAAERFIASYGPSPLADRVARLAGLSQP